MASSLNTGFTFSSPSFNSRSSQRFSSSLPFKWQFAIQRFSIQNISRQINHWKHQTIERFYKGAQGNVCSFSCTNATIRKFKDAIARYGNDRPSIGQAKGLDEFELLPLASIGQISRMSSFDSPIKDKLE
ncbi:Thioredoxin-like 1-1, chloroplastic [Capsicum chinense]|nr:Thioredoxin-like 1-1, chloroplastic [Capsicum chinense]